MQLNPLILEWIGYVGSVVVAVSLTMSSIKKLRWYNLVGASVFSFYGFSIGALPVGFLNLFISLADIYYLYKMYSFQESFKAITVDANNSYLLYFIDFYKAEITKFFPDFNISNLKMDNCFSFLLLRNAIVAGVFMGTIENDKLAVQLDFVTAEYRDLKPGDFIFSDNISLIKEQGIQQIKCYTENKTHQKYLHKMGFTAGRNKSLFIKNI